MAIIWYVDYHVFVQGRSNILCEQHLLFWTQDLLDFVLLHIFNTSEQLQVWNFAAAAAAHTEVVVAVATAAAAQVGLVE